MITIHTVMLVALGFLLAGLIGFAVVPAVQARAVRLTSERLRRSLPLTEAEIHADKDRLRAEYAIKIHKLETQVDAAKLSAARQSIEINRRDAWISALEGEGALLKGELEAAQNARSVLEQALCDRLPKLQERLAEAKALLMQRDRDITELTAEAERQSRALEEAAQINVQQKVALDRLAASAAYAVNGEGPAHSEIEALRAKTREQAALIARFHALVAGRSESRGQSRGESLTEDRGEARPSAPVPETDGVRTRVSGAETDLEQLQRDVSDAAAEADAKSARTPEALAASEMAQLQAAMRQQGAKVQDQEAEIARLKAELGAYKTVTANERSISLKESKIAMKARLAALQAQCDSQTETIRKLRAEVAAANERHARQARNFVAEMRRLGAGTRPVTGPNAPGPSDARRPAEQRRGLAERLGERTPDAKSAPSPAQARSAAPSVPLQRPRQPTGQSEQQASANGTGKVAEFLRALSEPTDARASAASTDEDAGAAGATGQDQTDNAEAQTPAKPQQQSEKGEKAEQQKPAEGQKQSESAEQPGPAAPAAERDGTRVRLMDRIARVSKT